MTYGYWMWTNGCGVRLVHVPERESICTAKEDISFITMMPCQIQHFEDSLHVFTTVYRGRGVVWFKIGDCGSPIPCNSGRSRGSSLGSAEPPFLRLIKKPTLL